MDFNIDKVEFLAQHNTLRMAQRYDGFDFVVFLFLVLNEIKRK